MSDHKHGSMEITEQEKTFEGFLRLSAYVAIGSICVLIFMALVNS